MSPTPTQLDKPSNGFVRYMRCVYNPLGFSKGYNAVLGNRRPLPRSIGPLLINII